jgi:hypothetical protein
VPALENAAAWSAVNYSKERAGAAQERRDVPGDPFGVALGGQAERLGVHLRDLPGDSGADHRVLVLLEGELLIGDGPGWRAGCMPRADYFFSLASHAVKARLIASGWSSGRKWVPAPTFTISRPAL